MSQCENCPPYVSYQEAAPLILEAKENTSPIQSASVNFTLFFSFFLYIWCQPLFFWRVLFILFPKQSTLRRVIQLENFCNHHCCVSLMERKIKITAEYETCCVRFISSCDSVSPSSSYLPEKESQQAQQQQAEQDGQNDDPPRHSSIGGFTSLWEHSQPHLEEHQHGDRTSARTFMSRGAINVLHCHTCATCVSAFCRTVFLLVRSRSREAFTITSAWCILE